jgi:hypothetical protein
VESVKSVDKSGASIVAKQVTCDSCCRSFLVPDEIGDFWVLCPYCEKVNPRARQDIRKGSQAGKYFGGWTFLSAVGTFIFVAGIMGAVLGTLGVFLEMRFWRGLGIYSLTLAGFTLLASFALILSGSLLLHADAKPGLANLGWRIILLVLLAFVIGVCGWVYVFDVCNSGPAS